MTISAWRNCTRDFMRTFHPGFDSHMQNFFLKITMSSVKEIIKHITNHADKHSIEHHNKLNAWLDYMIEYFDISQYRTPEGWAQMQNTKYQESPDLYTATYMWMDITATEMEAGRASDILGTVYEELFQSRGKASSLGQFFTPISVCDLLTHCTWQENQERF